MSRKLDLLWRFSLFVSLLILAFGAINVNGKAYNDDFLYYSEVPEVSMVR